MSGHATHALPASKPDGFSPTGYKRFRVCLAPVPSRVRIPSLLSPHKKGPQMGPFFKYVLAESWGIRTPDALLGHTRLAGEHLRPLGQLSVTAVL